MKTIVIHDYAGHPFQLLLSKHLSKKYKVHHIYFKNDYGPKADFNFKKIKNLKIHPIGKNILYEKKNFFLRFFKDIKYGQLVSKEINKIKPSVVISGNCPTFSQHFIIKSCKRNNSKFIFWIQDFYSVAASSILKKKISYLSKPIGALFKFFEKQHLNDSNGIIIISRYFLKILNRWNVKNNNIHYIPNWGDIKNIKVKSKIKSKFLKEKKLNSKLFNIVYNGTLALKHNPELFIKLAKTFKHIQFIIVGVGTGVEELKIINNKYKNLKIFPLQPYNMLNDVLSSSDVLIAVLNDDAGEFSVPSKILNYLCAGRPIILSAPKNNLSSRIINDSGAGMAFKNRDLKGIINYVKSLKINNKLRKLHSINSRKYAEENFNLKRIAKKFENIINSF